MTSTNVDVDPLPITFAEVREITCPNCGVHIGLEVAHEGRTYAWIGGMLVAHAGGYCVSCHKALYWSNGQGKLERVLEAARTNRAGMLTATERAEAERVARGGE